MKKENVVIVAGAILVVIFLLAFEFIIIPNTLIMVLGWFGVKLVYWQGLLLTCLLGYFLRDFKKNR